MAVVVADARDIEVDQAVAIKVAGEVGIGLVGVVVEGECLGLAAFASTRAPMARSGWRPSAGAATC